jgi:hypothetical protein
LQAEGFSPGDPPGLSALNRKQRDFRIGGRCCDLLLHHGPDDGIRLIGDGTARESAGCLTSSGPRSASEGDQLRDIHQSSALGPRRRVPRRTRPAASRPETNNTVSSRTGSTPE